mgnify:CR=1 FL=1
MLIGNESFNHMEGGKPKKGKKRSSKHKLSRTVTKTKNITDETNVGDGINDLNINEIFRLADFHFNKKNYIFRHLYDSYNKFLEEDVKNFLETGEHIFTEAITPSTYYKYRFQYENIRIDEPTLSNGIEPMFPSDARHNRMTYSVRLIANVSQYQDVIDIATGQKMTKLVGKKEENYHIATIPLMVRSNWCALIRNKGTDKNECEYDPGGYFIVNGNEKVIICQDKMVENKPLVFIKKDSGASSHIVQVNSRSYKPHGILQVLNVKMKKDKILILRVPILGEVNICAVFRALGFESDRDIINYITYDENDSDMVDIIRISLDACKNDKGTKISSQEEAFDYLIPKMRVLKKYTETDKETKLIQKKLHLKNLLANSFLPHVEGSPLKKGYYLGYMVNRLLKVYLGRMLLDDRDSYINKRVDLPGDLMFDLFKQQYKKLLGECKKFFDNRNKSNDTPMNVISNIKPNIIEQGFKASLSTGHWIRRQGVAQMLQRLTYLQTMAFLRRVDAPGGDASSGKLTSPRHLHQSSIPFLCCLTGDTEILQSDGSSTKLIKDMRNGDEITSVYQNDLSEIKSKITNYFKKTNEKLIKLTTITGRELKCTLDHQLLVRTSKNEYKMIDAGKLNVGDQVIIKNYNDNSQYDEYTKYIKHLDCDEAMEDSEFYKNYYINNNNLAIPIESINEIESEPVYDFETCIDSHTMIANGFVTSNCTQTPEHAKVGLTKHLSLISTFTIMSRDQYSLLKDYLSAKVIDVSDISCTKLKNHNVYKVFLNGDWIGITEKALELDEEMTAMKLRGDFDQKNVSIVTDHDEGEIKIYCDSGRMVRPTLRVNNNEVLVKRSHIQSISLNKSEKVNGKITEWDELLSKHNDLIEYIDTEQQPYVLVADKMKTVELMRQKMLKSLELQNSVKSNHVDNRYDELFFLKYTHCEIHPALLVGEITTNIPFYNCNQGPRSIFAYAQGRQAMGIYATNYRDRLDISFILYYPQKPLVSTRTAKYTNSEILPAGENAVVAIACYTGYNQEDSLIFNRSSIERGKFRAMYLKKYLVSVQKNQSTSQDDQFMKPDVSKVANIKHGAYDKLNDKGYVPEETRIENGDAIFGKVTPLTDPSPSGPQFKDNSELYKMHVPGVVDRVYIDNQNQEGYLTREALVRSERTPKIGDKYASRHGQKGTIGIIFDGVNMPFTKDGIKPDIILNPNAIPSRMTIGQLKESLIGKVAALQGMDADGTAFEEYDLEAVKDELEKLGYNRNGYEEMYNGMTGEKLKVEIFIGPTYYQRLKHLVEDKIHSRARGPTTSLTRQAPEGRSRDGGLRMGEMERDALLAHGLAQFIKEKLMDNSDPYIVWTCDKCGLFAQRFDRNGNKSESSNRDIYFCQACNNHTDINKIKLPYAFKLCMQEMMAMCIAPRIKCFKSIYDS